jgi:hypothetical protein
MAEADFSSTVGFGTAFGQGSTLIGLWNRTYCSVQVVGRSFSHGQGMRPGQSSSEVARACLLVSIPVSELRTQVADDETNVTGFGQNLSFDPDFRRRNR